MAEEQFRVIIKLSLQTDLHIVGPGRTLPLVDRAVEVDEAYVPIIPGSSLRGRLRAQLERLSNFIGEPICVAPRPDAMCPHYQFDQAKHPTPPQFCRACRIFGSAWRFSAITFTDWTLTTLWANRALPQRTNVSINRRLGAAEEQRLFVTETVPTVAGKDSLCFSGRIEGLLDPQDLGWLLAATRSLTHVGSGKARGLGRVRQADLQLEFYQPAAGQWQPQDWQKLLKEVLPTDAKDTN